MIASCLILFFTAIFIFIVIIINKHFYTIAAAKKEIPFNPRMTEDEHDYIKTRLEKLSYLIIIYISLLIHKYNHH